MFGTYTVSLDSVLAWLMVGLMFAGFFRFLKWSEGRKQKARELKRVEDDKKHAEREQKQLRDHQLNHGRQVYNWLVKQLAPYQKHGIEVRKLEDNGGGYTIEVVRQHEETMRGFDSLVQLTFDFVRYPAPYLGHIHYGSYGADLLCFVSNRAPFSGLDHLVVRDVLLEIERRTKREAAQV